MPTSSRCTMPCRSAAPVVAMRMPAGGEGPEHGRSLPADRGVRGDAGGLVDDHDVVVVVDDPEVGHRDRHDRAAPAFGCHDTSSHDAAAQAVGLAERHGRPARRRRHRRRRPRTCARSRASWRGRHRPASPSSPSGTGRLRESTSAVRVAPGLRVALGAPGRASSASDSATGLRRRSSSLRARTSRVPSRCRPISTRMRDGDHHRHDEDVGDVVDRRHHPRRVDEVDDVADREAGLAEQRGR